MSNNVKMLTRFTVKFWRGANKLIVRNMPLRLLGIQQVNIPFETLGIGEGSWSIPTESVNSNSICYCVGVGRDISFDLFLQKKYNCLVFSFDPTPSSIEYIESLGDIPISFHPWGIWNNEKSQKNIAYRRNEL